METPVDILGQGRSVRIDPSRCDGDMACMRVCPTEAIRVRGGKARIIESRCIDCGECIRVCKTRAISPVTNSFADLSRFEYTVALPSPVLYGQFGGKLAPERILAALEKAGFDCACDLTLAAEAINHAIASFVADYRGPRPLISCFCPTVVRLIQVRYPELIEQILPIETPKEIMAREIRKAKARSLNIAEEKIGIIYLTSCPGKMLDLIEHPGKARSDVDGVIAISDIYRTISSLLPLAGKDFEGCEGMEMSEIGLSWAILGGQTTFLKPENCLAVDGLRNVMRILDDASMGKLRDIDYVECHACPDGCVSGSLVVENPYVARARILHILERLRREPKERRRRPEEFFPDTQFVIDRRLAAAPRDPLDLDVGRAIEKVRQLEEIRRSLPNINCGACGAPSCAAFAEDVVRGEDRIESCVFVALRKLRAEKADVIDVPGAFGHGATGGKGAP